ncbi:MarR family winged helix-turn-helix transcriptional regulator [Geothrix fuzhouensis]|uniref:MarR family winged helix-turn-helix transcriptional regulator n=1 Tax=Geothrix fuzhouensis TaxID=2966451 RepID=UPI002148445E|nr:MarR family transcriptional regulator [Geothrix fuzhouensis]
MRNLRRMVKALEAYSMAVEKRYGLTGPQLWALWELSRSGPMGLKDLAERMYLNPSTVVGVVDRLVEKGLVARDPDPSDRRRVSLDLTPRGSELLKDSPHPAQGQLLHGLQGMSLKEVQDLHASTATLVKVMEAENLDATFFFADG